MENYKKLLVGQKADLLAYKVYIHTCGFPKEEKYGLTSQIRRAAISVPTNLVEGYGRFSRKELKQFINIALGSLMELEYLLSFSMRLGYFTEEAFVCLSEIRKELGSRLWRFYKKL